MGKIIAAVSVVVVILAGMYFWKASPDTVDTGSSPVGESVSGIVYYYGAECPHCKDVAEFIEANKIAEKVTFEKKEVWHDRANAREMTEKVKICGLNQAEVGVPFLFADGKCYIGTPDVTGFFKKAAGL